MANSTITKKSIIAELEEIARVGKEPVGATLKDSSVEFDLSVIKSRARRRRADEPKQQTN